MISKRRTFPDCYEGGISAQAQTVGKTSSWTGLVISSHIGHEESSRSLVEYELAIGHITEKSPLICKPFFTITNGHFKAHFRDLIRSATSA